MLTLYQFHCIPAPLRYNNPCKPNCGLENLTASHSLQDKSLQIVHTTRRIKRKSHGAKKRRECGAKIWEDCQNLQQLLYNKGPLQHCGLHILKAQPQCHETNPVTLSAVNPCNSFAFIGYIYTSKLKMCGLFSDIKAHIHVIKTLSFQNRLAICKPSIGNTSYLPNGSLDLFGRMLVGTKSCKRLFSP